MKNYNFMRRLAGLALILIGFSGLSAQTIQVKVCKGETVCHTIGGHRGIVQWEQSPDGNSWFSVPFMSMDTFCMTADSNGYYRASVSDGTCGPIFTQVMHVQVVQVTADAGVNALICGGGSATIGGSPAASGGIAPYIYMWTPPTGLSSDVIANPIASPANATNYLLQVMDSLGCVGTDSVTVMPSPQVIADAGPDEGVCLGGSVQIGGTPTGSGGTGPLTYLWSPGTGLSSTTVANPSANPTGAMTYFLTVTDSLGCLGMDTVNVDTNGQAMPDSAIFNYTGAVQTFVVPACVDSITMDVYGAQGGANWVNNVNYGGRVRARIAVTPGETLRVYVGQQPTSGTTAGYNGGGAGDGAGKGGGGASDVRRGAGTLNDRIIVGGGGGGAGYWSALHVVGGKGGGLTGGDGYRDPSYANNPGGLGGTQTAGGANGTCINLYVTTMAGSFGQGGTPLGFNCGCEGYGGGGGWYGGAGSGNCRGAGGGSSYTLPGAANVLHQQGVRVGNGQVKLIW
ncbi:MAG: glycine-rich protein [Bacteroidia bacterium]